MTHGLFRYSSYIALLLAFGSSLLLAAEVDLVQLVSANHRNHRGIELDELLVLSGFFSVLLAILTAFNVRLAGRERTHRAEMERAANLDPLTGIANRRLFFKQLKHALAQSRDSNHPCAVVLIDLDGFKQINDQFGHAAGDRVLVHVARQIDRWKGRGCLAARLGGDEFGLVLDGPAASAPQVETLAGKLREAVGEPIAQGDGELRVGCSIGFAFAGGEVNSPAALLEAADGEMYRVKRRNRDRLAASG